MTSPLPGDFNVTNTVLALAMLAELGVPVRDGAAALAAAGPVPGRMERVAAGHRSGEPVGVVDYAHTPAAVRAALATVRSQAKPLVVVLGAGGDRDHEKRPLMGEAAALADLVVITDDNPRSEDPALIRAALRAGAERAAAVSGAEVIEIADRHEAIAEAVRRAWTAAGTGVVLVAGKGHESGQRDRRGHPAVRRPCGAGARAGRGGWIAMIPMTLADLAEAVDGRLAGGVSPQDVVSGPVVIDSRQAGPGSLFVALPGARVDGHRFAASAHRTGAVAVLAAHEVEAPCVVVEDPVLALGRLARAVRDRLPGLHAVGITGSSGKTSTKDLLARVLPELGPTVAPQNSFNNEIGVPLTVLRCEDSTRYLVSEMGARAIGNIRYLCDIVAPQVAVVLNVGMAHVGEFGGREATAEAKGELVEALPADGLAVLNADDDLVAAMAARTTSRTVFVGRSPRADVQARGRPPGRRRPRHVHPGQPSSRSFRPGRGRPAGAR